MFYASDSAVKRSHQFQAAMTIHTGPRCPSNPQVQLYPIDPSQHNTRKCPHCFKIRAADVKLLAEATLRYHSPQCTCDACVLARRILL